MQPSSLFIVRIWAEPEARGRVAFYASLRAVDTEREVVFTRATDLARYLRTLVPAARRPRAAAATSNTPELTP